MGTNDGTNNARDFQRMQPKDIPNPNENDHLYPFAQSDIRAAEIRGATWALDHLLGMNEEEVERVLGGTSISAIRIVDARRKESEGFGPFGES
jgi:hypothetical protein